MHTLTRQQKFENLKETLALKEKKLKNLSEEVQKLKEKIRKLENSSQ